MPKLPLVSGQEASSALKRLGFVFVHQRGSHAVFTTRRPRLRGADAPRDQPGHIAWRAKAGRGN